ncbi:hypothetical protein EON65_12480 [archaeon]|nr:MAG: hypothetical protein EON65_12480 [archaeon]
MVGYCLENYFELRVAGYVRWTCNQASLNLSVMPTTEGLEGIETSHHDQWNYISQSQGHQSFVLI